MRAAAGILVLALAGAWRCAADPPAYTGSRQCGVCHPHIAASYRSTGMARSFVAATGALPGLDTPGGARFYHKASRRWYTILQRDGAAWVRRHQTGFDGREISVLEVRADYVIGSGNHAVGLLYRAADGRLLQLPVAWYSETGRWGMAPGYDSPLHVDFRRTVDAECMFCHNGYSLQRVKEELGSAPVFPPELAAGIDCERCHGPGSEHVRLARSGVTASQVRAAILNPAGLPPDRQLEVCMQCHLQTTSRPLPFSVRRPGRTVFSYDAREPLSSYMLFFDRSRAGTESFEVNHAAYRLRQSACFRGSPGQMVCTTCHDPHRAPRGDAAVRQYAEACRTCHGSLSAGHPGQPDCASCHMPKRRTEDAVHVIMTDHRIIRRPPPGGLLRPLQEAHEPAYQGDVALYYPPRAEPGDEPDIALAQIRDSANLATGLPRLSAAIDRHRPAAVSYRVELAEGYRKAGKAAEAVVEYNRALRVSPDLAAAWLGLGRALAMSGQPRQALGQLVAILPQVPPSAPLLNLVGSLQEHAGHLAAAESAFRDAIKAGPELAEPYLNLGVTLSGQHKLAAAREAFREAIRRAPELGAAHRNLAYLLATLRQNAEAEYHFQEALRLDARDWSAHLNYGRLLAATGRRDEAAGHFRKAAQSPDPALRRDSLSAMGR